MVFAFSKFSSALILDDIPVNNIAGTAIAESGVIAIPKDKADPAKLVAIPNSPIARAVPAVDNTPVTTGNEPLAANAMTAPAAAPVTPLENVLS